MKWGKHDKQIAINEFFNEHKNKWYYSEYLNKEVKIIYIKDWKVWYWSDTEGKTQYSNHDVRKFVNWAKEV